MEIYRAQYADAILVYRHGTPIWRPDIKEKTWNSLLLWKRLLFARELVHFHVNTSPNTWNVKTAKNPNKTALSRRHLDVTYGGELENWKSSSLKTNDATELETCKKIYFYVILHLLTIKIQQA